MTDVTQLAETLVATVTADGAADTDLFDLDLSALAELTEAERAEFAAALLSKTVGLQGEASTLRVQALAKHKETVAMLRQADHVDFLAQLRAVHAQVQAQLTEAEQLEAAQAATVAELETVDTEERDRLTDAEKHYAELTEQHRRYISFKAKASRLSESLVRINAARTVMDEARADANKAATAHINARAALTAQRQHVAEVREALDIANTATAKAQHHPEIAPRSIETLLFALTDAATGYTTLTAEEQAQVRGILAMFAQNTGADRPARAESRQAGYEQGLRDGRDENRRWNPTPLGQQTVHAPGIVPGSGRR